VAGVCQPQSFGDYGYIVESVKCQYTARTITDEFCRHIKHGTCGGPPSIKQQQQQQQQQPLLPQHEYEYDPQNIPAITVSHSMGWVHHTAISDSSTSQTSRLK